VLPAAAACALTLISSDGLALELLDGEALLAASGDMEVLGEVHGAESVRAVDRSVRGHLRLNIVCLARKGE
jgi:hypothetical protein